MRCNPYLRSNQDPEPLSDQEPGNEGRNIVGVEFAKITNEKPAHTNAHTLNHAICRVEEVISGGSRNVWKRLRESTKEARIVVM
jgi:HD superfamily phosphodiesterase